ncbi:MAG: helix-turn-helix domain-containing protein [Microbacterium sp.]|uniref:TetR/AcrR family transcriptional regulator n=1 Tax=Microbacterium sp. TaxID=51671 RepID=UPI0039E587CB
MPETKATTTGERYPKRAARAAATRAAIIEAAGELFATGGYAGTTMKAIAERAGVSVESVYLAGSKASLLSAALTVAFSGADDDRPLPETQAYAAVFALPVDEALDRYVELVSTSIARSDALWRTARVAADAEPAIRALLEQSLARRAADIAAAGPWLVARGVVVPADADDAVATLSMLVSHETYEHFTDQFGWSPARYGAWLRDALDRLIVHRSQGDRS